MELQFCKKNICFYHEICTSVRMFFKNVDFYNELCMLFALAQSKTYLCSKTLFFTMNYALFFKNISFYNKLYTVWLGIILRPF